MQNTHFLDLLVISGPDEGMRYTVEPNSFRVIGRNGILSHTTELMTENGGSVLNADQIEIIDQQTGSSLDPKRVLPAKRGPDILLFDPKVSRTHAMILVTKEKKCICDLLSRNGTRLNENVVSGAEIKNDDVVIVGSTHFVVKFG